MDKLDSGIAYVMTKYSEHPKSCGMTPVGHFLFTMRLFALSFVSSVAFLVHAVFPWILTDTGEYLLELLHEHSCPLKSVSNVPSITPSNTPSNTPCDTPKPTKLLLTSDTSEEDELNNESETETKKNQ